MSASLAPEARNQARAEFALVRVSIVVKVFEAITNSVVSGSSFFRVWMIWGAIDVRDEVHGKAFVAVGLERFADHQRTQVRAADADIDDVGDRAAGAADPLAAADLVGEREHPGQHVIDVGHHVVTVDEDRGVRPVAQRDVQHGAIFGVVDLLAREHRVDPGLDAGVDSQLLQQRQGLIVDAVLRIVKLDAGRFGDIAFSARGILSEDFAQVKRRPLLGQGGECGPGGGLCGVHR